MLNQRQKKSPYREIPINKIKIGDFNVRTLEQDKKIEELAESIQKHGLLQPVVVFEEGDEFHLLIGQRRLRAYRWLKKAGHHGYGDIPAVILLKAPDEETSKILSLSENIQRVELNRADIIEVISFLYNRYKKSAKEVARVLGKSIPYVYEHLKLEDAPQQVKQMLSKRELSKEDVKRVMEMAVDDKDKMVAIAKEMKELTPPERKRLAEVAKAKPDKKVKKLIEEIKKPQIEEKIIVALTPALRLALDRAVKAIGLSQEEVAKKALAEWLSGKGYYKESYAAQ